jgi:nucleotide-binding universal stress UspA family protein
MKTILIATDFSEGSKHAMLYACELAKNFDSKVILFHAYQVPIPSFEGSVGITTGDIKADAEKRLQDQLSAINGIVKVKPESWCVESEPTAGILRAARAANAEVIIAGMGGGGRTYKKLFGSTVTKLAAITTIPIIVVPETAASLDLRKIAVATEKDIPSGTYAQQFRFLSEIIQRFHSELYLVRIARNHYRQEYESFNYPAHLAEAFESLDPAYKSIEGKPVPRALNRFIEEYQVNMLVMLPKKHSLFDRFFAKTTTRSVLFHTQVPVLVLPREFDRTQSLIHNAQ